MGNKVSATDVGLTEKQVADWQKKYGLSKNQVTQFLLFFKNRKGKDGTLSRADFVEVMVLAGSPVEVAEQMFQSVDIDGSGTMDIQEFLALYGTGLEKQS
jgi:Ca2+-binding EF-hand superfamily protein